MEEVEATYEGVWQTEPHLQYVTGNTVTIGGNYYANYDLIELRKEAVQILLNKADRCLSLGLDQIDDALSVDEEGHYSIPTDQHTDKYLNHLFTLADKLVEYYTKGTKPEVINDIVT